MLYGLPAEDLLKNLHHSLDLMEAKSHLGLDNCFADKIRQILVRRIGRIEATLAATPGAPKAHKTPSFTPRAS
jgi:hypothetical protein